jgi:predicted DNA-binding mobile mystery protein A
MGKSQMSHFPSKPTEGWIKEVRHSLGMTLSKLAKACDVSIPTIAQAERGEAQGRITLETLKRAAEAMNCEFVYAFKPKSDMHEFVQQKTYEKAKRILLNADLHMTLEDQKVSGDLEERIKRLQKKLLSEGKVW